MPTPDPSRLSMHECCCIQCALGRDPPETMPPICTAVLAPPALQIGSSCRLLLFSLAVPMNSKRSPVLLSRREKVTQPVASVELAAGMQPGQDVLISFTLSLLAAAAACSGLQERAGGTTKTALCLCCSGQICFGHFLFHLSIPVS